ncbi:DUF664 domain-containing protein [Streptomyces sp. NPDC059118]|uniref:mycothiol transferase n=1 Tax=unclassified Streptomyces TaxID=2593676 RepID=UPI0036AEBF52
MEGGRVGDHALISRHAFFQHAHRSAHSIGIKAGRDESMRLPGDSRGSADEEEQRVVMVHVLLEYGRHPGHADFLRVALSSSSDVICRWVWA